MKRSVSETVRTAIEPIVTELGYSIWDITFGKVGADYHLEITIDKAEGIDINDCEKVHRAIDPILDEVDPIEGFYYLDVSSPGLERELRTAEHIAATLGQTVEAKLFAAYEGRKSVLGTLVSGDAESVTIKDEAAEITIPTDKISRLNTVFSEKEEND
jgi:ribosome maturation factor RimP